MGEALVNTKRQRIEGLAWALVSAFSFGGLGYFARLLAHEGFSVISSLALRFSIAAVTLGVLDFVLWRGERRSAVPLSDRLVSVAFGALGYGTSAGLFFWSMEYISTGLANILLFQSPLVVLALSFLSGRSRNIPWLVVATIVLGLVLVLWPSDATFHVLGVAAGVGAALWYGAYLFLTEARTKRLPSRTLTLDVLSGCALAFLAMGAVSGQLQLPHTAWAWCAVFGQAILCTIVPIMALFAAFRLIGGRDATLMSALEPVVTVVIGVLALGEPWTLLQCLGAILVLGGIVMLARIDGVD